MEKIKDLSHIEKETRSGAKVLVLNTGSVISPEAEAMLQALHSRSVGGIKSHLETLAKTGSDKFMSTYYVGYGHKSIGDLGSATVFIEGVSMLAAKAIQDWPLYSGQEASTRYIDFSKQPFFDPVGSKKSQKIMDDWRSFYLNGLEEMIEVLKERFPRNEDEDEKVYEKAIKARAFDVMRSFLPAGATTNLAWHSNLRQLADKLATLRHHPLAEVQDLACKTEEALIEAFPNSFDLKRYKETEDHHKMLNKEFNYFREKDPVDFEVFQDSVNREMLEEYRRALEERPLKTELPKTIAECGTLGFKFLLDFGSFRDIQRHRSVTQRMPLLTTENGFASWYLSELEEEMKKEAEKLIDDQKEAINGIDVSEEVKQYFIAMGFNTANRLVGNLSALVYLVELRSTRFVHPTLRERALQMAKEMKKRFKEQGLILHLDPEPNRFDIKRGLQDIIKDK
ncbi:MAG: FAD-dependent thymidylate synthase [Candidatus Paceibacterota bacterium]